MPEVIVNPGNTLVAGKDAKHLGPGDKVKLPQEECDRLIALNVVRLPDADAAKAEAARKAAEEEAARKAEAEAAAQKAAAEKAAAEEAARKAAEEEAARLAEQGNGGNA
ncbi:MAG: hypothetical protein JNM76_14615 [Betaproteobacteria bacterium]|nr:hypothetical protein [Betaproteobacteria bacterium]